jgi:Na+/H+-dicarboxylate symporter
VIGLGAKSILAPDILLWLVNNIFDLIEKLFMSALMMVIAPLVFFSVIEGITSMSDATDIGRMGGKLMLLSVVKLSVVLVMSI